MAIVSYIREITEFMEYAADNGLSANERLLWHALMHIFNVHRRAQGSVWPDGFIRVANKRLLSHLPMQYDAMAKARNSLRQRGLIDFENGKRNKESPMYRLIYFASESSQRDVPPSHPVDNPPGDDEMVDGCEDYPLKTDNIGGNKGGNIKGNMGGNTQGNNGDIIYRLRQDSTVTVTQALDTHTANSAAGRCAREGTFDLAWKTSEKARGAVAQRLLDYYADSDRADIDTENTFGLLCEAMKCGIGPEDIKALIDNGLNAGRYPSGSLESDVLRLYVERGVGERARRDKAMCLRMANGDAQLAGKLYHSRSQEEGCGLWP